MRHYTGEIRLRLHPRLNSADKSLEALEGVALLSRFVAARLGSIQRRAQNIDRFVESFQRYREGMTILSPMRKGKTSRIVESRRRSMQHLCNQRQRLQRARP